jgi:hypothetical protein
MRKWSSRCALYHIVIGTIPGAAITETQPSTRWKTKPFALA